MVWFAFTATTAEECIASEISESTDAFLHSISQRIIGIQLSIRSKSNHDSAYSQVEKNGYGQRDDRGKWKETSSRLGLMSHGRDRFEAYVSEEDV